MAFTRFLLAPCLLLAVLSAPAFKGFESRTEAQLEFDRLYGGEAVTVPAPDSGGNEFNSIRKFMAFVLSHPDQKLVLVHATEKQAEAAGLLRTFINRRRGCSVEDAEQSNASLTMAGEAQTDMARLEGVKTILIGSPKDSPFIAGMAQRREIELTHEKAQYCLLDRPNCLVIACGDDRMFLELVRVFIHSFNQLPDHSYNYYFLN